MPWDDENPTALSECIFAVSANIFVKQHHPTAFAFSFHYL